MRFAQVKEEAEGRGTRSKMHNPSHLGRVNNRYPGTFESRILTEGARHQTCAARNFIENS